MASVPTGKVPRPIRLLTLNAHQGFSALRRHNALLRIREALRASGADLVFLQEIGVAHGSQATSSQYELLAEQAWPQHAYGRNAVVTSGHHGNALLSKHPIVEWKNHDASVGRAERRGFLHCLLDVPGAKVPLHAVCVHLALFESHRRQQVVRLLELIAASVPRDAPLVVAGDFNDWRQHAHRALVKTGSLQEIHAASIGRPRRTFPAWRPLLRLDRIYVRNLEHRPLSLPSRPWARVSDHVPLAGEVWQA